MAGLTYPPAVITTLKVVFPFALGLFLKWHLDFKWLCMTTFIATFLEIIVLLENVPCPQRHPAGSVALSPLVFQNSLAAISCV